MCKVDLHLVILASCEDNLICLKLIANVLGLLSKLYHESKTDFLVVVCAWVPEEGKQSLS